MTIADGVIWLCIAFAILGFGYSVRREWNTHRRRIIFLHAKRASNAGSIPATLVLIWGGFQPRILADVPGVRILIALSGLIWLFYAIDSFMSEDSSQANVVTVPISAAAGAGQQTAGQGAEKIQPDSS